MRFCVLVMIGVLVACSNNKGGERADEELAGRARASIERMTKAIADNHQVPDTMASGCRIHDEIVHLRGVDKYKTLVDELDRLCNVERWLELISYHLTDADRQRVAQPDALVLDACTTSDVALARKELEKQHALDKAAGMLQRYAEMCPNAPR